MNVTFIPTEVSGVNFYRAWQPAEAMRSKRNNVAVLWYQSDMFQRINWEMGLLEGDSQETIIQTINYACRWSDVVVWMGLHTNESLEMFQQMKRRYPQTAFVMEIDDLVTDIPEYNPDAAAGYMPGSSLIDKTFKQMKMSDAVIVSTETLKEFYQPYNKNIYVLPNVIDLSLWPRPCSSPRGRRVNIGWVGGGTHRGDLESIRDVVFEMLYRRKDVEFTFLHGVPNFFKHKVGCRYFDQSDPTYRQFYFGKKCPECKGIDRLNWTADFASIKNYPKWVSSYKFDIGIAPLLDNNFNRGKSNLRWLEMSALGIPTVASNVGHFQETIKHGETGFLVNNHSEWLDCLDRLCDDARLRADIGKNARREMKKYWSPELTGRRYKSVLQEIVDAKSNKIGLSDTDRGFNRRPQSRNLVGVAEAV